MMFDSRAEQERHESFLRWEAETEKYAAKFRSGELTQIPSGTWDNYLGSINEQYASAYTESLPPVVRGFLKYKYEHMGLIEFLFGGYDKHGVSG